MGLQLSGSVQLEGNLLVTGSANSVFENITVTNRITANEINVQFVSSSIIYSSGSNRFGDEAGDKHQFTGSVDVIGSGTFSNSVRSNSHIIVSDGGGSSVVLQGYIADTLRIASAGSTNDGGSRGNLIAGQLIAANANIEGSTTASAGLINGTTDAFFDLNRSASGNASRVRFQTVGTDEFEIGLKGGVPGFHITNGAATELLTISGSNVGLGTVNPVAPVHVVGTVEANGSLYRGVFGGTSVQDADMTGLTGGNGSELQIQSPSTTRGAFLTLGGGMAFGEAMGGMAFYNSNNVDGKRCRAFIVGGQDGATAGEQGSYLSFGTVDNTGTTPSEGMRLSRLGRLGIGIDPTNILHVNAPTGIDAVARFSRGPSNAGDILFGIGDYGGGNQCRIGAQQLAFEVNRANGAGLSTGTTAMFIDSSARVGVNYNNSAIHTHGSGAYSAPLTVKASVANALTLLNSTTGGDAQVAINFVNEFVSNQYNYIARIIAEPEGAWTSTASTRDSRLSFFTTLNGVTDEAMRITSTKEFFFGKTVEDNAVQGIYSQNGYIAITNTRVDGAGTIYRANRGGSDGTLFDFMQAGVSEGDISVSGTTVSYNGGHLSRYSQTSTNIRIEGLVKGTVMSNLDQMAVWINPETGEPHENEQLNCMKISDVEGDKNVAGVFVNWDNGDELFTNDMNIAMTGDMIIRIAEGVVVEKGDLLISAGDGTAKPQSDDLIRSNTIGKVISNHVTCVYEDGSYCVPCVLMAC